MSELNEVTSSLTVRKIGNNNVNSSISIKALNKMLGKVVVIAVGDSALASSITVQRFEKVESSIQVYSDYVIEDLVFPPRYGNQRRSSIYVLYRSNLTSSLNVRPKNKMFGTVEVQQPPRHTVDLLPIADSFVRNGLQTFNYGSQQFMLVGRHTDNELFRSMLKFDISSVPQEMVIESAEIVVQKTSISDIPVDIGAYKAIGEWTELGVTWRNQPISNTLLDSSEAPLENAEMRFNVTDDVIDWYSDSEIQHDGYVLKGVNENVQQRVQFNSRENANLQPVLRVIYYDNRVFSFGRTQIPSSLFVVAQGQSSLLSSIEVPSYDQRGSLPSSILVREPEAVFSSISVIRRNLTSELSVQRAEDNSLSSLISVQESRSNEIDGQIVVSKPFITSSINVFEHSNLESSIIVQKFDESNLQSVLTISRPDIFSSMFILYRDNLQSNIVVRNGEEDSIPSILKISRPFVTSSITVRQSDFNSLNSQLNVRRTANNGINSSIVTSRNFLLCSISPMHFRAISSSITVRERKVDNLSSEIYIPFRNNLPSTISVVGASMIPSSLYVLSGYLASNIIVPYREISEITSSATIRVTFANEIQCLLVIPGYGQENNYFYIL